MRPAVKLARVATLLRQAYGPRRPLRRRDNPLNALIHTILSQNTSDTNSDRAYAALRQRFPDWEDVHRTPLRTLISTIRSGGLANIKAVRIKALLEEIWGEQGHFDLSFLRDLSDDEVQAYLARFKGIGSKTIACVLLFGMGRPAFPVDTHVFRVSRRLGLVDGRQTPERAQEFLESRIPPDDRHALHLHLVQHGRQVCKAQRPLCAECVLARVCASVRA
jgi:endonuclease-3